MQVALLLDDERIQSYFATALTEMVEKTSAEIELVVINDEPDDGPLEYVRKGLDRPDWARIVGGQMVWERIVGTPSFREHVPYERVPGAGDAPVVRCEPAPHDGFGNELPEDIVERIADETDVVIRNGFGVLKGDILFEPEHGVLSYHHGDPREYRGGPPGFWEFLHGRDTAGVIVQRLAPELDDGDVIVFEQIDIAEARTWREVQMRLFEGSTGMLATAIHRLEDEAEPIVFDEAGPIFTAPGLADYLRYLSKNNVGRLRIVLEG